MKIQITLVLNENQFSFSVKTLYAIGEILILVSPPLVNEPSTLTLLLDQ
jgi:hypothetical protein